MVLQNALNPANDQDFIDEAVSDSDPYEDPRPNSSTLQYSIDMKNLPKPVPIIGNVLGYQRRFKQEAHLKIIQASKELGRPLTQDEVDAFAYWLAKRQAITSWGAPVGFASGVWRAYDTKKTYKFPFWQPNSNHLNVNIFGPLKGPPAILCWHTLRILAYGLTGDFIGRLFFGSYAMSTAAVGASNDTRLSEYMNSIKDKIRDFPKNDIRRQNPMGNVGRKITRPLEDVTDDASPTSMENTFYDEPKGELDQASSNSVNPKVAAENWNTTKPVPFPPQATETNSLDDFYGSTPPKETGMTNDLGSDNQHISAWERIRRGQHTSLSNIPTKPTRAPRSKQLSKENESNYDSFSYSKTEEERAYAKEAQNDFEARMNHERNERNSM